MKYAIIYLQRASLAPTGGGKTLGASLGNVLILSYSILNTISHSIPYQRPLKQQRNEVDFFSIFNEKLMSIHHRS